MMLRSSTPAPAERLAVLRVLIGGFAVGYLTIRASALLSMADADFASGFEPVGVLWWVDAPWNATVIGGLLVATVLLGVGYTLGFAFRAVGPLFAVALLVLTTYHSSGGQLLWFENLLVLHALIVGFSPAADALAIPIQLRSARSLVEHDRRLADPDRYGWAVATAAMVTVATYALAGVAKLRAGGVEWFLGDSLRNHVAYSAARLRLLGGDPSPLAAPLLEHRWLFRPAAVLTLLLELGAPVCLVVRRLRWPSMIGLWCMHVAIAATMFVVFPYHLSLVAMAPLFELEHLPRLLSRRRTRAV